MDAILKIEREEDIAILTLNRPDALNALSRALVADLSEALRSLSADDSLRAIVLTGAGRAFCAGVDLREMSQDDGAIEGFAWHGPDSLFAIAHACPHPIIAAVNGFAITGGLELAMLSDFIIASDKAVFADTHARVGITPSWGMTQVLPRLIGLNRARQMSLTGEFVDATRACDWGLANEVTTAETLLPRAKELAHLIAQTDPTTMRRIRGLIIEGADLLRPDALKRETQVFDTHMAGSVSMESVARGRDSATKRGKAQVSGE
jgi:enoyl-CoA hydratase